jgi:heme exporter protein CcmD
MDLQNFLSMSGYGAYVWSCYGLTLAVLVWNGLSARRELREQIVQATRRAQMQSSEQRS